MAAWRDIHVFLSSTFRDMQAERDALVKRVFPTLRARLEPYRLRLVEIDLRWGITEQQEQGDQVLQLCLAAVDKAHPYFVGLLGDRYGSLPRRIPDELRKLYTWLPESESNRKSLTELEILHGVLNRPLSSHRALFYLRDSAPLDGVARSLRFLLSEGADNPRPGDSREHLESRLRDAGITNSTDVIGLLLAGQPEPPELRSVLTSRDRLEIVKLRLRRAGLVRMDGYNWVFQGLKVRWKLARLALADDVLFERLRAAAPDGIVTPVLYESLAGEPRVSEFLQMYGTVALGRLEELTAHVEADLWERLREEPEIQSAEAIRIAGTQPGVQRRKAARSERGTVSFFAHFMRDRLPMHFKGLPPAVANLFLATAVQKLPAADRISLLNMQALWSDRSEDHAVAIEDSAGDRSEETDGHERFAESRLHFYVHRSYVEDTIDSHLQTPSQQLLVVLGAPGAGKTAVLANTWQAARRAPGKCLVHFVGATPNSRTLPGTLLRLSEDLDLICSEKLEILSDTIDNLAAAFAGALGNLPADQHAVLIIDALDQMDTANQSHDLHWLPLTLPQNVRLIVSLTKDAPPTSALTSALRLRHARWLDLDDHPLSLADRRHLIEQIPSLAAKSLDDRDRATLLAMPATVNPLYLKVALEELRGFGSFQLLNARIAEFHKAETPSEIFSQVIEGLSVDFDPRVVSETLGSLVISRNGLTESELASTVSRAIGRVDECDDEWIHGETAAILRYLQPYLQWHDRHVSIHHRSLREAIGQTYFQNDPDRLRQTHANLADFFEQTGLRAQPPWSDPHSRSTAETLYHRLEAADWNGLLRLLNDDTFVFRKGRSPYFRDLSREYFRALATAPLDYAIALAGAFVRCCGQYFSLHDVASQTVVELIRHHEERFLTLAPYLCGHAVLWREELLRVSASQSLTVSKNPQCAEAVLNLIRDSYDGDETAGFYEVDLHRQSRGVPECSGAL